MSSLVRNATSNFSRRVDGYELLDQNEEITTREEKENMGHQNRTFSKRRAQSVVASFSYRRDRARKRQIFLRSYKLSTVDDNWGRPKTRSHKAKKIVVKIKAVVISVVSLMRMGSFKSCSCRSAICAAAPISIKKCC
ncbi:hypothetical protein COLO4_05331 [Corchorus olitorius]|uniref:Uncharacterized protein n=1 Tax=Corchorus olitorius TaxID=93759 RepID=A0A1R3KR76_9ROSI|nr:hypothetical protein COLO4_05331 [Corchorus olitorius]